MVYSDFAIDMLKDRLLEKSMKNSTPKKYACDMFEAYEVIQQLQKQISKIQNEAETCETKANPLSHVKRIEFVHQLGPYEMEKVALVNCDHITEEYARECIVSDRYCDDVLVIPKSQWLSLFQNKPKEVPGHEQSENL